MTVAIDYDSTWSADPELWRSFARYAKKRGHVVLLITNRSDTPKNRLEVMRAVGGHVDHAILAGAQPKEMAAERYGLSPDIWIDDNPITVTHGLEGYV